MSDTIIAILLSPFLIAFLIYLWEESAKRDFTLDVPVEGDER
jgi:hypothetical protein